MKMQLNTSFFRCLICNSFHVEISTTSWRCQTCNREYQIEQGVPILVRNWEQQERELKQARTVKPNWYVEEQPPEITSPWKHHLKKRRLYVEEKITGYLQTMGKASVATLLDLGCGDGNHIPSLQKYAGLFFASDYNLLRLVRAKVRYPEANIFLADILDYPYIF